MAKKILPSMTAAASTVFDAEIADLDAQIAELAARRTALRMQGRGTIKRHRQRDRLTDRKIQTLKVAGFYSDGGNLYLDFKDPPSKNWVVRYSRNGRTRDLGIGNYPAVSLAEARLKRNAALTKLRKGVDPVDERRAANLAAKIEAPKAMTFKQCAERYIAAHEHGWKNSVHIYQWRQTLETYVYSVFGDAPVAAIDTALVMQAIEPHWLTKTETMVRTRGRIERILDWARARGYRAGENAARWRGHLDSLLPKRSKVAPVQNHPALPYAELPGFFAELTTNTGIGSLALQFAILTAARTGEVIGARWDEINPVDKVWEIPAGRMKMGKAHRVPLSEPVLAILATLKRLPSSDFVFAAHARRPVSNMIMLMQLRRMGCADLTVHGFRSTFSDWVAEKTGFPTEVREMSLAHKISNAVEAAYRRGDLFEKRRELMRQWAAYCTGPVPAGEVVSLADGRSLA
jgi:integrase